MKYFFSTILFLSACFLQTSSLHAQWIQTDAPYSCSVQCLALYDSSLVIGTSGNGVYQSIDGGNSWTQIDQFVEASSIVHMKQNLFIGTWTGGLYTYSLNNGTWIITSIGLSDKFIYAIAYIDSIIFAGTYSSGVYRSSDMGATWEPLSAGISSSTAVRSLFVHKKTIYAGTDRQGVFYSTDYGLSWTSIGNALSNYYINTFAATDDTIFVGTSSEGIFRSINSGVTWNAVNSGLGNLSINSLLIRGTTLFAGTENTIFISTDEGNSWKTVSPHLPFSYAMNLISYGTNLIAGSIGSGMFLSTDEGLSWRSSNNGLPCKTITSFADAKTSYYAGSYDGILLRSTDKGDHWLTNTSIMGSQSPDNKISALAASGSILYIGMSGYGIQGLYEYEGGGKSWSMNNSIPSSNIISLMYNNKQLFTGTSAGIARCTLSTNNGEAAVWIPINTGLTDSIVNVFIALPESGNTYTYFAGTNSNGVYLSTNDGESWTSVSNGLTGSKILSFTYTTNETGKVTLFAGTEDAGIFRTTDKGSHWISASLGLEGISIPALSSYKNINNIVYLFAGTEHGVFASSNNGNSWTNIISDLPEMNTCSLAVFDSSLFVGTYSEGIWKRSLSDFVTKTDDLQTSLPRTIFMEQNYPNPFNPSTVLSYRLSSFSRVRLLIYDILGREVAVLADGAKEAGYYTARFDASHLANGIYFACLIATPHQGSSNGVGRSIVQIKKMVLMK